MSIATVWRRLLQRTRRSELEYELREEMAHHLELLARDLEHAGLSPADAYQAASRKFGNRTVLGEESRQSWSYPSLDSIAADVRYAARTLRRSPTFAIVAIGAIGIAVGVNCGVFTLLDALMWRPIPVPDAGSLVQVRAIDARGAESNLLSYPEFAELRAQSRTLTGVVAGAWRPVALAAERGLLAEPIMGSALFVSGNYLGMMGARPAVGRLLQPNDEREGAAPVAMLTHRFWEQKFAASPDVIGQTLVVNRVRVTIIGVTPQNFTSTEPRAPSVWLPLTLAEATGIVPRLQSREARALIVHGRLRDGLSREEAAAELSTIVRRIPASRSGANDAISATVARASSYFSLRPKEQEILAPAIFAVLMVLVIACANLANLLLARAVARQREIAIRLSLGASRRRIVRQLLTESLLISVFGTAVGVVVADWTLTSAARLIFASLPPEAGEMLLSLHPEWRVFAFAAVLAVASALVFAGAPGYEVRFDRGA